MNKQRKIMILMIFILVILLVAIVYLYIHPTQQKDNIYTDSTNNTQTVTQVEVTKQTIKKTLAGSGQVSSALTETLPLHASYYLKESYIEENTYIAAGEKLLQYTNGTYLTAPYNCVISNISIPAVTEQCTSKHTIEVIATDTLQIELSIAESDINLVSIGQEVQVKLDVKEEISYIGYISSINEVATYSSNGSNFKAIVIFPNDGTIKIGMSASCEVILQEVENVIAVPSEAVETVGTIKYVEIVNQDGSINKVQVKTGVENDAYIEIVEGITEGEKVQITLSSSSNIEWQNGNMEEKMEQFMQKGGNRQEIPSAGTIPMK